jgi:hypothetical protein
LKQNLTIIVCLVLAWATTARGETENPATSQTAGASTMPATQPAITPAEQKLIDLLNADDWRARQSAEDGLVALGPSTRAAMMWLSSTGSAEQRTRAQSVLARLDIAAANSPTLITLHLKNVNPRDVFSAIAKQAGTELGFFPENLWVKERGIPFQPVSIDLDQQPFWHAIEQAGQIANARVQTMNTGTGSKLTVQQGNPGEDWLSGPHSDSGQFTVLPVQISRNQTVTFSPTAAKMSSSEIRFRLLVDPKVTVLSVIYRPKLTEAIDDKGNSLLPPDDQAMGDQVGPALTFEMSSPLAFPNDGFTKLTSLKGTISVAVASHMEHLDLPDVKAAVNQPKLIGEWSLVVESCQIGQRDGSYALKVTVPDRTVDANAVYSLIGQVRLVDAANQTISTGYNSGSGDGLHYEIKKTFSSQEVIHLPVSLKWDLPMETKEKQVPFHFTDLPLPTP